MLNAPALRIPFLKNNYALACLFFALALAIAPFSAAAQDLSYLAPGKPDVFALLAPPPEPGSAEQDADLAEVRAVSAAATMDQKTAAFAEKKFTVFNFTVPVGGFFKPTKLPKTEAFFKRVQEDAASVVDSSKDVYRRPRPYVIDRSLANGKLETSFSYPSGHSTETMTLGLVLTEVFPEKRDAILAHARLMGWHRVQIARHYPTDIYAGRVLAQAIVREMDANPQFQHDLAEVKAEVATAQQ
jgi:acid phosphatase (class A)